MDTAKRTKKILLVDDDRDLVDLLHYLFQKEGYAVQSALDGLAALEALKSDQMDIVVLDLKLPKRGGLDVLRELRRHDRVPVVILSAMTDEDNVVTALGWGADDYLVKPFRPRELKARVEALLRRSGAENPVPRVPGKPMQCGQMSLDPMKHEVMIAGQPVHLTQHEFALLHYMMLNHDIVLTIEDIVVNVWGYNSEGDANMVRKVMSRLRRKIEPDPTRPRYLVNTPGVGYMLRDKAQAP